jgi:hypothetical protein
MVITSNPVFQASSMGNVRGNALLTCKQKKFRLLFPNEGHGLVSTLQQIIIQSVHSPQTVLSVEDCSNWLFLRTVPV